MIQIVVGALAGGGAHNCAVARVQVPRGRIHAHGRGPVGGQVLCEQSHVLARAAASATRGGVAIPRNLRVIAGELLVRLERAEVDGGASLRCVPAK